MEEKKQAESAPQSISERLDNLLAKAQAPDQIKTVKEFIADKRAAEASEEMTVSNFSVSYDESQDMTEATEYVAEESMPESEGPTSSSI